MTLCNRSSSPRQPIHVRAVRRVQLGVQLLHLALQLSNALVQLLLAFARCKLPLQRRWHVRVRGQSGAARRSRVHDSGALCTRCTRKRPTRVRALTGVGTCWQVALRHLVLPLLSLQIGAQARLHAAHLQAAKTASLPSQLSPGLKTCAPTGGLRACSPGSYPASSFKMSILP